jgi:chemotaxis protein MotB
MNERERETFEDQKEDTGQWMVTFSDLIMLMLTFFVMLLSMSSMDKSKLEEIVLDFQAAPGLLGYTSATRLKDLGQLINTFSDSENKLVIDQKLLKDLLLPSIPIDKAKLTVKDILKLIGLSDDKRGIVLSFQEDLLFDSGQASIKKSALPFLDIVARSIVSTPNDILIMGHTDNIPIQSELYASNWELSSYRGLSVLEYFLEQKGLTPERFSVGGYGPSRPLNPNDTTKNSASNRRVEIIFRHLKGV